MERSRLVAAVVSVVAIIGITAGGVGWHDRSLAAEEAATQAAAQQLAAQQIQKRADATEAAAQARKLQVLDAAQKRVEAGHAARYAAQEQEGERTRTEKAHFNQGVPPTVAYAGNGDAPVNNDPDARIMPDSADDYDSPKQPEQDDPNAPKTPEQAVRANPYFDSANQYSINEANAAEGRQ